MIWNKDKVVDDLREVAEPKALHRLLPQIETTWEKIREEYGADHKESPGKASSGEMSEEK